MTDHYPEQVRQQLAEARAELAEAARLSHEFRNDRDRLARELANSQSATTSSQTSSCPGPVECGHEAALGQAEARMAAALGLHQPFDRNGLSLCAHCSNIGRYGTTAWPCATALALGVAPPPPPCPRCRGYGQVPDWSNWNHEHGEPRPKPCPDCSIDNPTTPGAAE